MADDMSLKIDLTADGSSAAAEVQDLEVRLAALETAFKSASTGAVEQAAATTGATEALTKHNVVVKDGSNALEAMASHAGTAGRAFSAMGLEAEGAASRVEGLIGLMEEMQSAVPGLLAVGAALVAIGATFTFFKDGIEAAGEFQSEMETLRAAVEAQGASWDAASASVENFIEVESRASGITRNELVASLNELVTAGASVADAQTIVAVAEETAIAKHMQLHEVTQLLLEAEAGRGQGLARLDPAIRKLIQSHADLSTVLAALHKLNQDQISDGDSLERAQAREKAAMQEASETIGNALIPMMTHLSEEMTGFVENAEDFGSGIMAFFGNVGKAIGDTVTLIEHAVAVWGDAMHGDVKGAKSEGEAALHSRLALIHDIANASKGAGKAWNELINGQEAGQRGHDEANEATYLHDQRLKSIRLDNNPQLGLGRGKGGHSGAGSSSPGFQAQDIQTAAVDTNALAAAHDALSKSLTSSTNAQLALKSVIDPTMDSEKLQGEAVAKLQQAYEAAKAAIPQLIEDIKSDRDAEQSAQSVMQQSYANYQQATKALSDLEQTLAGKTKLTKDEKQALDDAKEGQKVAKQAYDESNASLKEVTKSLGEHQRALDSDTKAVQAFNAEQQKLIVGLNDTIEKDKEKQQEELATYGKSLDDQAKYWAQKLAFDQAASKLYYDQHHAWNETLLKDEEDSYTKLLDIQTKAIEEREKQEKDAFQKETKDIAGFLDDVILKHQNFKDMFKSIWDDIVKIFIEDVAKMIAESKMFKDIFGNMSASPGSNNGFGGSSGSSGGGFLQSLLGGFGGGGSSIGSGGELYTGNAATTSTESQIGSNGDLVGSPGSDATSAIHVNVAGAAQGALMGAGIGAAISGLDGGNSTWGTVGGAIGGAFGGPVGAAVGGFLGSLFGPHETPSEQPDVSEPTMQFGGSTINYGTMMADLQGSAYQANGTTYQASSGYSTLAGNKDLAQQLVAWESNPSNLAGLNAQQMAVVQQLQSLGNNLTVTDEHQGTFTFADGQHMSVSDFMSLLSNVSQLPGAPGASGGNPLSTPVYNVTHAFPDWQNPQIALGGNYTPGGPSGSNITTGTGQGGTGTRVPGGGSPIHIGPINVGGVVRTDTELAETINEIVGKYLAQHTFRALL